MRTLETETLNAIKFLLDKGLIDITDVLNRVYKAGILVGQSSGYQHFVGAGAGGTTTGGSVVYQSTTTGHAGGGIKG